MKKTSYVLIGIILSILFLHVGQAQAVQNIFLDPAQKSNIFATATPTFTPTPTVLIIKNPNIILPKISLAAKNTVTPTPTVGTKDTVTPTETMGTKNTVTGSPAPEENKATDAGTVTTVTNTATAAPTTTGVQTKDVVTYILIGAILLVLLAQAFWPKKSKTTETKPEEPKAE